MRISDWSSDVCSSDRCAMAAEHLLQRVRHLADRGAGTGRVDRKRKQVARAVGGRLGQGVERLAAGLLVACRADELQPLDLQIGRSACRERGVQYVGIPVCAVSFKKKKKNKKKY